MIGPHFKKIKEIEEYFSGCEVVPYLVEEVQAYNLPVLDLKEGQCSRECATH